MGTKKKTAKKATKKATKTARPRMTAKHARSKAVRVKAANRRRMTQPPLFSDPVHQPSGAVLTRALLVRFSPDEYGWIRKAAYEAHKSGAAYIRAAVVKVLNDHMLSMKPKDREAWHADAQRSAAANGAGEVAQ